MSRRAKTIIIAVVAIMMLATAAVAGTRAYKTFSGNYDRCYPNYVGIKVGTPLPNQYTVVRRYDDGYLLTREVKSNSSKVAYVYTGDWILTGRASGWDIEASPGTWIKLFCYGPYG